MPEDQTPLLKKIVSEVIQRRLYDLDLSRVSLEEKLGTDGLQLDPASVLRRRLTTEREEEVNHTIVQALLRAVLRPEFKKQIEDGLSHNLELFLDECEKQVPFPAPEKQGDDGDEERFRDWQRTVERRRKSNQQDYIYTIALHLDAQFDSLISANQKNIFNGVIQQIDEQGHSQIKKYAARKTCLTVFLIFCFVVLALNILLIIIGKTSAAKPATISGAVGLGITFIGFILCCLLKCQLRRQFPDISISATALMDSISYTLTEEDEKSRSEIPPHHRFPLELDSIRLMVSQKQLEALFNNAPDFVITDLLHVITYFIYDARVAEKILKHVKRNDDEVAGDRHSITLPGIEEDNQRRRIMIDREKDEIALEMIPRSASTRLAPSDFKEEEDPDEKVPESPQKTSSDGDKIADEILSVIKSNVARLGPTPSNTDLKSPLLKKEDD